MITIPLPIPVPTIKLEGNQVSIDRTATELAKKARGLGNVLTFDNEKSMPLCCACKEPTAHFGTSEPPRGYRWGGWFCHHCLYQGKLADRFGLVIDQVTCEIVPAVVFNRNGIPVND